MNLEILKQLEETILDRQKNPSDKSYTTKLFNGGQNLILKKLGEENAELIMGFMKDDKKEIAMEAADYLYHLMVGLANQGISFADVMNVLEERFGKSGLKK